MNPTAPVTALRAMPGAPQKRAPAGALFVRTDESCLDARGLGSRDVLDRQLDAAAVVHVQYQHFDFLAFLQHVGDFLDTLISLTSAFVLGTLIGAERQYRQRTAGLRTNVLVAVGAAALDRKSVV